jgi:putative addiction module component (TIGR02574 family)
MAATLEKVTHDALDLPQRQRARLAHTLILSIDDESEPDVTAVWDAEIKRRVDEIRSGQVKGIPAEEVFAQLSDKYH